MMNFRFQTRLGRTVFVKFEMAGNHEGRSKVGNPVQLKTGEQVEVCRLCCIVIKDFLKKFSLDILQVPR